MRKIFVFLFLMAFSQLSFSGDTEEDIRLNRLEQDAIKHIKSGNWGAAEEKIRINREIDRLRANSRPARLEARKKQLAEKRAEYAKQAAAERARKNTPEYLQQDAVKRIKNANYGIAAAKEAIEHENKIGARTGYVNASEIHRAGSYMLAWEKSRDQAWEDYKAAGGAIASIDQIK